MISNAGILTDNERVVLMIAREGENLAPVGMWKEAVLALEERGLLEKKDAFNYVITKAGRKAINDDENDEIAEIIRLNNAVAREKGNA